MGARWMCTFAPSPSFFAEGVDMDVALSSRPQSMRRLPSNEDRTFLKLDDEEDRVLCQLIILANRDRLDRLGDSGPYGVRASDYLKSHSRISKRLSGGHYGLDSGDLLSQHRLGKRLDKEMALEAVLVDRLNRAQPQAVDIFGRLDYIAHQVPASPTKKFRWMDKMDIFGYAYAPQLGRDLTGAERPSSDTSSWN